MARAVEGGGVFVVEWREKMALGRAFKLISARLGRALYKLNMSL